MGIWVHPTIIAIPITIITMIIGILNAIDNGHATLPMISWIRALITMFKESGPHPFFLRTNVYRPCLPIFFFIIFTKSIDIVFLFLFFKNSVFTNT